MCGLVTRFKGERANINRIIFLIFTIMIFVLVAGLRNNIGDTQSYVNGYTGLVNFMGFTEESKDKGFTIFQLILYKINTDPQFMLFVTSLITQSCIVYTLYKYRSYFELEVYMYITCGIFLVTMNGIRQAMVGAILFLCTRLIIEGKFIPYTIIVFILSTMHSSAMIMIPVYFIARKQMWSKTTFIIIVVASVGFIFFYQLLPGFFGVLDGSSYSEYESWMTSEDGDGGSSLMRVLVNAVPVILSYIKRNELKEKWKEGNIFVNISLINLIFNVFGLYNWIFVRFQLYFQYYNLVLIPYIIKNCFEEKERDLIYYSFIICYFIYFYYEQVMGGVGLGYMSNYISF